jgi:signal peptidase I
MEPVRDAQSVRRDDANVASASSSPAPRENGSDRALIGYTLVALVVALFIRFFVAAPYVVSGASMDPTFRDWDYLIIDRVTYRAETPARGDVIVFDLPQDPSRALIKRIIGLPGETVAISGAVVTITNDEHPDGFTLDESYLDPENLGDIENVRVVVPEDSYFVLGDNRRVSADSRIWGFLPRHDITGRVLLRLYPFDHVAVLPGQARYAPGATDTITN